MMKIITSIILVFLSCIAGAFGQVLEATENYGVPMDPEEVFIHHNASFFITGETLYYKFYCRNSSNKRLSTLSKVGYVELVDSKKNSVFKHKISLQQGQGHGDFLVPTSIASGNYKLIGYTRRMVGGSDESFFETYINIVNPFKNEQEDHFSPGQTGEEMPEPLPANPFAGKQALNATNFKIELANSQYEKRSRVNLFIETSGTFPGSSGTVSISVRKLEDILLLPAYTAQNYPSTNRQEYSAKKTLPVFLPELRGQIIGGRILPIESNEAEVPVGNITVALSIPGTPFFLRIVQTNDSGRFILNLENKDFTSRSFLQVLGENAGKYKIVLDPDPAINYEQLVFEPLELKLAHKERIKARSIYSQIENSYIEVKQDSMLWNAKPFPFYGLLPEVYVLDDFTRFPSLNETFIEIVKLARIRKINGKSMLDLVGSFTETHVNLVPLVLVDGVLLQDHSEIINYDARKLKAIHILREKYFMGPKVFKGIISFETIGGDFYDLMGKNNINELEMVRPQRDKVYFGPKYQNMDSSKNRVPDYRIQLLWNPNLHIKNPATPVEFYTSDVPGDYEIIVEGFTVEGLPVSLKKVITIK